MGILYPLPRSDRDSGDIAAIASQTVFGPFTFILFDALDVEVRTTAPAASTSVIVDPALYTVTPVTSLPGLFSIVFTTGLAVDTIVRVRGKRIHERQTDVTQGGTVRSVPLETEFDRQAVVLQELRRDVNAFGTSTPATANNIDNYGADPTGVADSGPAIVAAIAALPADGGIIRFGRGNYLIATNVPFTKPILSLGEGGDNFHQGNAATRVYATAAALDMFSVRSHNVRFDRIDISGSGARDAAGMGRGIVVGDDIVIVTDGAIDIGVSATTFNSATAAFMAADIGKKIWVAGAGAAGINHVTTIASINTTTSVELAAAASTTVSGATARWGISYFGFAFENGSIASHAIGIDLLSHQEPIIRRSKITCHDGIKVQNLLSADAGEAIIADNVIAADATAGKGVHWTGGGGLRLLNNKMILAQWDLYIDWSQDTSGGPQIIGNSFENGTGHIFVTGDGTVDLQHWIVEGNIFNGGSEGIQFDNAAGTGWVKELLIAGNMVKSGATTNLLHIGRAVDGFMIDGNIIDCQSFGGSTGIVVEVGAANGLIGVNRYQNCPTDVSNASATVAVGVPLAQGGLGRALADPGADRLMFWDDSAGQMEWATVSTGVALSGTDLKMQHLGLQNLAGVGADRILFYDTSANSFQWLSLGANLAITTTVLDLADDIEAATGKFGDSPTGANPLVVRKAAGGTIVNFQSGITTAYLTISNTTGSSLFGTSGNTAFIQAPAVGHCEMQLSGGGLSDLYVDTIKPKSYTVATLPSASAKGAGAQIYVTDEVGGATGAESDGTNWRRYADRAIAA